MVTPARVAETPTTFTRKSGRKITANRNPAPTRKIAAVPSDITRPRNASRRRIGSAARRSVATNQPADARHLRGDEPERHAAERQVDEEDPVPAEGVRDEAARERADDVG